MGMTAAELRALRNAIKAGDELGYNRNYTRGVLKFGQEGMTPKARLARAREMGFDTPGYHATAYDFPEFRTGARGAAFFGRTPERAARGAQSDRNTVMPVVLPAQEVEGLAPHRSIEQMPARVVGADNMDEVEKGLPPTLPWWRVYDERGNGESVVYEKRPISPQSWDSAIQTGRDVYGETLPSWGTRENDRYQAQRALERGFSGFAQADESGVSVAMADPSRIRSPFATFDPARAHRRDLLAASIPAVVAAGAALYPQDADAAPRMTAEELAALRRSIKGQTVNDNRTDDLQSLRASLQGVKAPAPSPAPKPSLGVIPGGLAGLGPGVADAAQRFNQGLDTSLDVAGFFDPSMGYATETARALKDLPGKVGAAGTVALAPVQGAVNMLGGIGQLPDMAASGLAAIKRAIKAQQEDAQRMRAFDVPRRR